MDYPLEKLFGRNVSIRLSKGIIYFWKRILSRFPKEWNEHIKNKNKKKKKGIQKNGAKKVRNKNYSIGKGNIIWFFYHRKGVGHNRGSLEQSY